eukprot:40411-Eustigmatos_ZCMA.PRE.1
MSSVEFTSVGQHLQVEGRSPMVWLKGISSTGGRSCMSCSNSLHRASLMTTAAHTHALRDQGTSSPRPLDTSPPFALERSTKPICPE